MNTYYVAGLPYSDELYHHGIKGQKWGVRRSRQELGYDDKGRLDAIQRRMLKTYKKSMNKYSRLTTRAEKRKRKGKNAAKLLDKANSFLNDANVQKSMSKTYNSLTKYERKRINRGYRRIRSAMFQTTNDYYSRRSKDYYNRRAKGNNTTSNGTTRYAFNIGTTRYSYNIGKMMADNYLKSELLSRKK